jgi:hypothetical protein
MKSVLAIIQRHNQTLNDHPFFGSLTPKANLADAMAFAPVIAYWVMSFQDVIRINAKLAKDAQIQKILQQYVSEDTGHEQWFLEDLAMIYGHGKHELGWLFGLEYAATREAALALASEVFHFSDDRLRLVYVEILESTFQVFVRHMSQHVRRLGQTDRFKYFGRTHAEAEAGHQAFHEDSGAHRNLVLPEPLRSQAVALVERSSAAFLRLADASFASMTRS